MNVSSKNHCKKIYLFSYIGLTIDVTEKRKYMYFNLIWYIYHTIYSVVRKFARISCSGDFLFAVFEAAENGYQRNLISFLYQHAQYSDCSKFSEISCTGMAIFAISLLFLMDFPIIRVFLSESSE